MKEVDMRYLQEAREEIRGERRFAFSFTRNPIDRFLSGYNEVEFLLYQRHDNTNRLSLWHPVGSSERFREFIRLVLSSSVQFDKDSRQDVASGELMHVVPFTGTILQARRSKEMKGKGLRLFKVENFNEEWSRLAAESGFDLQRVSQISQIAPHESSTDPLATKASAYNFLFGNASEDGKFYLRALCRIYLCDFICGDYILPPLCSDIHNEVPKLLNSYFEYRNFRFF